MRAYEVHTPNTSAHNAPTKMYTNTTNVPDAPHCKGASTHLESNAAHRQVRPVFDHVQVLRHQTGCVNQTLGRLCVISSLQHQSSFCHAAIFFFFTSTCSWLKMHLFQAAFA